jgi:chromatin remodeling complex protein RSC6
MANRKNSKVAPEAQIKNVEAQAQAKPVETQKKVAKAPVSKKKPVVKVVEDEVEDEDEDEVEVEDVVEEDATVDASSEDSKQKTKRETPTKESIIASFEEIISSIENEISVLRENQNKNKGIKFLRTLNKKLKTLRNQSGRIIKQKNSTKKTVTNNVNSGFLKPVAISNEMAKFTGWDPTELKSRVDVTKFLCSYIKDNDLQNPKDRRQIFADAKLSKLLKYDSKKEEKPLTYFMIQKCLKTHFPKTEVVV